MLRTKIAMMLGVVAATTAALAPSTPVAAVTLTYSGALTNPNSINSFFFTSDGSSSNVTFRSYSYSGGTSTNGTTFGGGGFNPILTIFGPIATSTGTLQDQYLFEIDRLPPQTPGDISLVRTLARGNYRAVISVAPNFAQGSSFSDGFTNTNTSFGSGRSSFYAFDISGNSVTATVPEPTAIVGTLLAGCAVIGFKRKLAAKNKQ